MTGSFFITASMYLGWILSSEALVLAGNYAGRGGKAAFFALLTALALSYFGATLTKQQVQTVSTPPDTGFIPASTELAATTALVIFISTGILVTAGFTFNETFLYWFPNFGFSALLLILIFIIHLLGTRAVETSQQIFVALATLSLLTIIIAGLLTYSELSGISSLLASPPSTLTDTITLAAGGLFFFVGIVRPQNRQLKPFQLFYMLAFAALLLLCWQVVALKHVPHNKLAQSSIPYILVAREILGQTGRILIGLTIISGTCAGVNYFMSMATSAGSSLLIKASPALQGKSSAIKRLLALLFASIIGLSMALGLAGNPHLELYTYGALLLWLLSGGVQILVHVLLLQSTSKLKNILSYIPPALFFFAFIFLIMTNDNSLSLVIFIALVLCLSAVFTSAIFFLGKKCNQQPLQQGD